MTDAAGRLRVAAHASAQGTWRMAFLAPSRPMAPLVGSFAAYAERDTQFARRRELPTSMAVLVFNLGHDLRVEHPLDTRATFAPGGGFYSGPSATYAVTETDGAQEGAQVMLTLPGARRLLGRPLGEVGDGLTAAADLLGAEAGAITGRLMAARTQADRLAVLEHALSRRFAAEGAVPRDLAWAWRHMQARAGCVRVGALAAELGCSRKHFTTRFRHEFGLPPKLFARILRFEQAVGLIRRGQFAGWADLAASCGYADQAHLTREFREFAGSPPAAFLRRRLPDDGGFTD